MPLTGPILAHRCGLAQVRRFVRLRSTNTTAAALIERRQLRTPAAVIAAEQTAGRGQRGNAWWSGRGSLTVTFAFAAQGDRAPQELPLRAGLAVREAVARYVDADRLTLKWPNDVLADGRKLAGILCERVRNTDLIGIGVNLAGSFQRAPADVRRRATSIRALTGQTPDADELFIGLALALRDAWQANDWHEKINRVHALTGQPVAIDTGDEIRRGICRGIDKRGRLMVLGCAVTHHIESGRLL